MPDGSNIYAGVAGYFGKPDQTGKSGVFQRAAKGGDWKHVLGSCEAYTVFVKPDNPEIVFAGTNDGVWRSTDRGNSFKRTAFPDKTQVWSFMVDRRDPKKPLALFVGSPKPHVPWPENIGYDPAQGKLPPTHIDTPATRDFRCRYYTEVTRADAWLGELYDLTRAKLIQATLSAAATDGR